MVFDLEYIGCKNVVSKYTNEWTFEYNNSKGKLIQKGPHKFTLYLNNVKVCNAQTWSACSRYIMQGGK